MHFCAVHRHFMTLDIKIGQKWVGWRIHIYEVKNTKYANIELNIAIDRPKLPR